MDNHYKNLRLAERGARISILAYIILSVAKLLIGFLSNSEALTADGLNNTTDIIASLAVLIGLKISRKPADDNHPYGHFRAETIASLIASLIMIAVGINVLIQAARSVYYFKEKEPDIISAFTAIACSILIYLVYRYNLKIAKKINSQGLLAAAKDNLSDAWVSIGTAIGIFASQFGLAWIDPLTAVIVGMLIIKTGWDIFKEASHNLTDGYSKVKLENIKQSIFLIDEVMEVKEIKGRMHGNITLLDIVVSVNAELTVVESHDITDLIEKKMKDEYGIQEIIVHVEPYFEV